MKALFPIVILSLLMLISCKKEETKPTTNPTTETPTNTTESTGLEITVKDYLGNIITGAIVKLYLSEYDLIQGTNQVGSTSFSDKNGKVIFNNLLPTKYYWYIESGCQNNVNGGVTTVSSLTENKLNTLDVILSRTGTMLFVNSSTDNYRVYINGKAMFDMGGNTAKYKYNIPTGNYTIRVLQLDGYIFNATDITYSGTVSCGNTLTTTFP